MMAVEVSKKHTINLNNKAEVIFKLTAKNLYYF
jgi:hypothetical protein